MSKLFKLKEWVSIPEAARHLSQMLAEPVNEADIYQMGLSKHLKISVYFPNTARARLGKVVPYAQVPQVELPNLSGQVTKYAQGYYLPDEDETVEIYNITESTPFIVFDEKVVVINGLWDLAMMGNEKIDVEFDLQQKIGGPEVTMINMEGTFLNRPDGTWAALQHQFRDQKITNEDGKSTTTKGEYYPAGGLGEDCIKVIRTTELVEFQSRLDGGNSTKPPSSREHTTYLNIIGALLELHGQKDAATIDAIIEKYPTAQGLKKRTLEGKFAEARRSLKSS